ncbi:Fumarate and nitrate reduction regulatory protein [Cedecea neteri]|uniref:Fumarate and nitrate reduction regulatory protein n=1 Tax=Cedecea neteri TaxID=158822 RepID=A0A2X3J2V1_9ENTR|nr:Fumarate and nitrate reduction regulatory protein [Cedecea neteri]
MIPEKRIIRRIQSGGCAIHCQDCSISQLCIPFTLNEHELDQLDNIIERKKPIQKGQTLFKAGDELKIAVRYSLRHHQKLHHYRAGR